MALKEVAFAASLNKRFAPSRASTCGRQGGAGGAARLNFIFFDDRARFDASADQLAEALSTDIDWIRKHTELGEAARRWGGRPPGRIAAALARCWKRPSAGSPRVRRCARADRGNASVHRESRRAGDAAAEPVDGRVGCRVRGGGRLGRSSPIGSAGSRFRVRQGRSREKNRPGEMRRSQIGSRPLLRTQSLFLADLSAPAARGA